MDEAVRQLIVDTDPGIDDAMALLFLQAMPRTRIAAITSVFGNAAVDVTTRNARYLAERFGIDAPVHAGAAQPLRIPRRPSPVHVHGGDGLGDAAALPGAGPGAAGRPAHEHMVELIRAQPGAISVLALGPLTNLALALRHDPGIAHLVERVVVMGGAFGWSGRRGNVSPVAEANVRNDPDAADEVLAAAWPVTLVGLDVTSHCVLPQEQARRLADGPTMSLARIKEAMNRASGNTLSQQLDVERDFQRELGKSEDFKEGVAAFLAKRKPVFKGK